MLRRLSMLFVFAALQPLASVASAATIDFASIEEATVTFTGTGDTFEFLPSGGDGFHVTSSDGVAGDAAGLVGRIDGTFTIGAIDVNDGVERAPVTGVGTLVIDDGTGSEFTADLDWTSIATIGSIGGMNVFGDVNLSNFAYGGLNADLQQLAAFPAGAVTATFQFVPEVSLTQLTADGTSHSTSYSGTFVAVPEPTSMIVCGIGMLLMLGFGAKRRVRG